MQTTIMTSEDDGYDVHFSDEQMQEEANRLVAEYLGNDVYSEDYAGLSQDLSLSEHDYEGLLKLYAITRKTWIERMEARAFLFWEDKIIENLVKKGE